MANDIRFPEIALTGSLGDFAKVMSKGTEVPEEFYFAAALTYLGAMCSGKLAVDIAFDSQPRLYTVLLGESYGAKKSTAMKKTVSFFKEIGSDLHPADLYGVGSAEGLVAKLKDNARVILLYDELKSFVDKTRVQGAVLLPMVTSLFEQNHWQNATRKKETSDLISDAHVSIVGCCTDDTYSRMWTTEAISIGFPNRLFVVHASAREKVAWPEPPDPDVLLRIQGRLRKQIERVKHGLKFTSTDEAKAKWEAWYKAPRESEHARRLDTLGFKLMGLLALTMDKSEIDEEVIGIVAAILDYELAIRELTDPIDAESNIAKMEERIRRQLRGKGALSHRNLRRYTHGDKVGLWAFNSALKNLKECGDIGFDGALYSMLLSPDLSPVSK